MDVRSQLFLEQYLNSLEPELIEKYTSFSSDYFCTDEHNANLCADLILKGEKQATCSMDYWYSEKGETLPTVGHLQVVTKWDGDPVCIVEITSVSKCQYKDITPEFAAAEGEGDKSLSFWQEVHRTFFSIECEELGISFNDSILLVLERFKLVWP